MCLELRDVGDISAVIEAHKVRLVIPIIVVLMGVAFVELVLRGSFSAVVACMARIMAMTTFDVIVTPLLFHPFDVVFVRTRTPIWVRII